ncbi:MAG: hypothetical protein EAY66_08625 [Sphingobacteriales bacterium]|jgi:hypothetical protein|nr:MAG: hypothetical protein EAY66_08625 [Sphingobacteriales bacterium]
MSKEIEKFIIENKNKFDTDEPNPILWDKIGAKLEEAYAKDVKIKKLKPWYILLKVAAILLLFMGIGLLGVQYQKYNSQQISSINPKFAKQESQFASIIELKQSALKSVEKQNPNLYKSFEIEQQKLEKEYKDLKLEINASPNQDCIIKAMKHNLQLQIQLLNQQINVVDEVQKLKNETKDENHTL